MMFLTNTQHRQNRRAVSVWSKEAMGNLPYSCRLCYTWQFLIQLLMLYSLQMLLSTWIDVILNVLAAKF